MKAMASWAATLRDELDNIGKCNSISRLAIEFRTKPLPLEQHQTAIEELRDRIKEQCRRLKILPVIHSQHIHVSLFEGGTNILEREMQRKTPPYYQAMNETFFQVAPLVLLPEEFKPRPSRICKDNGYTENTNDPVRTEFRLLSSEYACDPDLNLLLSLGALQNTVSKKRVDSLTTEADTYQSATTKMAESHVLSSFFGVSTLSTLVKIVKQYPQVSDRSITIEQVEK